MSIQAVSAMDISMKNDPKAAAQFQDQLSRTADETEILLDRLLNLGPSAPTRLLEAMRYATLGGGKRFRPFLVVASASLFGVPRSQALMAAAALECIHCYSLVHDDLPAMDNDDLRRGRPTTHKAFDEATAILVGDSLLTYAFDLLSRTEVHSSAKVRIELVSALARAAGVLGMAGGQMLDLLAEGRFAAAPPALDLREIQTLQAMKTGALLRFGSSAGAILGEAPQAQRAALERYGTAVGEAFQIADDLLDLEGDPNIVGKATHKDAAANKGTFVAVLGAEAARERLAKLVAEAESALTGFGEEADILRAAAHFVAQRRS
jgi:farnesyl diphosphate synthase